MSNPPLHGVDDGPTGYGVLGEGPARAVLGISTNGTAIEGRTSRPGDGPAVFGTASGNGPGAQGNAFGPQSVGVWGQGRIGVQGNGSGDGEGVRGVGAQGPGVTGTSQTQAGVQGTSVTGFGVHGTSADGDGVHGDAAGNGSSGVAGFNSAGGHGVWGGSASGIGVYGQSGAGGAPAIYAKNTGGGAAALLDGKVAVSSDLTVGGAAHVAQALTVASDLTVNGTIHVANDILLGGGADCAEEFDVAAGCDASPGTVMIIDDSGALVPSAQAYDKRVVGVISGAGAYRPAITLDRQDRPSGRRGVVALVGKAFCKVDAGFGAIRAGDLLSASPTPGHAMRAADQAQAFGAVLGKALQPLPEGTGLVAMLIALQ
ncbi:hypothetical protein DFR50_113130 [Roseiarcus fermentans]|uniref:Uncharacterized protein n=1 Tax=Roseiarcus fermentans TaxID=1473586 RepID=A0A366FE56_9HYPH|nr:hypothetical protein [Roseiarcus fermentans]RBP12938.1 hypothetical protein DFR50_113130 [Roseiarcus fermentans]